MWSVFRYDAMGVTFTHDMRNGGDKYAANQVVLPLALDTPRKGRCSQGLAHACEYL
jgi:hypothetical protein